MSVFGAKAEVARTSPNCRECPTSDMGPSPTKAERACGHTGGGYIAGYAPARPGWGGLCHSNIRLSMSSLTGGDLLAFALRPACSTSKGGHYEKWMVHLSLRH